ncbi:hypothetical protein C0991_011758 [Blastosporella zonata]|nr:hypothetical protein C0991_011758 [Blastosporella zonata]
MVNQRKFIELSRTSKSALLKSRLYAARACSPRNTPIHVRWGEAPYDARYPSVEGVLDDILLQSHVHDFFLSTTIKCRRSLFRVFFKRHKHLPYNASLDIQGDLVVMRVASRNRDSFVNLRSTDMHVLDRSLKK